jgi:hypothetical protein
MLLSGAAQRTKEGVATYPLFLKKRIATKITITIITASTRSFIAVSCDYESPIPLPASTRTAIFDVGRKATFTEVASFTAP